jgi:hypothetical protein
VFQTIDLLVVAGVLVLLVATQVLVLAVMVAMEAHRL